MINPGDTYLIRLSNCKDSLSVMLLCLLCAVQRGVALSHLTPIRPECARAAYLYNGDTSRSGIQTGILPKVAFPEC